MQTYKGDKKPQINELRSHIRLKFLSELCQFEFSQYNGIRIDKEMETKANNFVSSMDKYISLVEKRLKLKGVEEDEFLEHVEKLYEILKILFYLDTQNLQDIFDELSKKYIKQIQQNEN